MNKKAILNTAVCSYDAKLKLFIVESPLLDNFSGCEPTKKAAWSTFSSVIDELWADYLEGKMVGNQYTKRGRPPKNRISLHCQVKAETLDQIRELATELGISQGECIDYLYAHFAADKTVHGGGKVAAKQSGRPKATAIGATRKSK